MLRWLSVFSIFMSVLLVACSPPTTAQSPVGESESIGQNLPISAQATFPQGTKINLEVVTTPEEQAKGLMYRPALPDDRGMLFIFPSAQPVKFWMKNVPVSLDMVFLRNEVVQYIQDEAPPCNREPCPTYGPNVPIDAVIELRAGRVAELGLKVGDQIKIDF
ncbi:DUF192 domain-containing protein [Cronbergia sp. UHCC 0137]|uniref:DUF192 domain-containing protein n=1 Tax=Cronbergia sp. UHCC 0137 TaxID=3110239 RepID=UPI002B1F4D48|nr:DUF192 domain-containing protein [Cronbergia sp. UHCC 0137]MEA5617197.1 DUF192 domain-containing protein [Cronbergia sp. UHCC 0137]